ncbi:hypothetical protein ONZ45_g10865 [Pleurotus djamor]|nr:hypothetical protein ONZ45_g10865 [Pleurotus djamor]
MSSKATHKALGTPELFGHILTYLQFHDLKQCATVSKTWSNTVLDILWEVVSSLEQILRLLAPLNIVKRNYKLDIVRFSEPIKADAWERVKFYAKRIRELCFNDVQKYDLSQVVSAVTASATNVSQPMFTNLRKLSCPCTPLALTALFISPTLSSLSFTTDVSHDDISFFTTTLPLGVPRLQLLSISACWQSSRNQTNDPDVMTMLERMPTIVDVELPSGWLSRLSPSAVDILGQRPNLRRLAATVEVGSLDAEPLLGFASAFSPPLTEGRFSGLQELDIVSPIDLVMSTLSTGNRTPLAKLFVSDPSETNEYMSADDLSSFIKMVSTNYPRLTHLSIGHNHSFGDSIEPNPGPQVTFEHLKPLLQLSQLTFLRIRHVFIFKLEEDELLRLLQSLPSLKTLHFSERPVQYINDDFLPISALGSLPPVCPNLEVLGIYISPMDYPEDMDDTLPRFPKLKELSVGRSEFPIDNATDRSYQPQDIARFLSYILPEDCQLTYDFVSDIGDPYGGEDYSQEFTRCWDKVKKCLQAIRQDEEITSPFDDDDDDDESYERPIGFPYY